MPGLADLARGISLVARRRQALGLGMVPPLVSSLLLVGLLVVLALRIGALAAWLTPFADGWSPGVSGFVRALVAVVVYAAAMLLAVLTFSTLTLAIGAPVYDKVSAVIDAEVSPVADAGTEPAHRMVGRAVGQVLVTLGMSVLGALACFAVGLVPVAGAVLGAVSSAVFGGWMMARELCGPALERRGHRTLAARAAVLRTRPWTVLTFGVPAFWLLSSPFVSVVFFPGAVAGGTLLVRRLLGEPTRRADPGPDGRSMVTDG